ncbi:MAG: AraC family transcriptional regulator [Verrucomicrobia bacterium]|nr:AraC family transcriptional regulator [Verrucomicrobiota bacterium]
MLGKHEGSIGWADGLIEKLSFGLSETHPVRLFRYYSSDKKTFWHDMHYALELGILLSGKMRREYRKTQLDLVPGQVWLCNMWEPHGFRITQSPCEIVFFEIFPPMLVGTHFAEASDLNWSAPFYVTPQHRPQASDLQARQRLLTTARGLKRLLGRLGSAPVLLLRLRLLETLLLVCERWTPAQTPQKWSADSLERMSKAIQMVFESKDRVTTQFAAQACGMNRNVFSRMFTQTMGVEYAEFGLRYRISAVAEELHRTSTPLKMMAGCWGFADISHLHRCFTRYYECTPSDYRRRFSTDGKTRR